MEQKHRQYSAKELRARLDLTQAEMAEKLGITQQTYNAWEKNIAKVPISKVAAIARLCGVTLDEIKIF